MGSWLYNIKISPPKKHGGYTKTPKFSAVPQEEFLPAAGSLMTVAAHLAPELERRFWDAVLRQLEATRPEAGGNVSSWENESAIEWDFRGFEWDLVGFEWDLNEI